MKISMNFFIIFFIVYNRLFVVIFKFLVSTAIEIWTTRFSKRLFKVKDEDEEKNRLIEFVFSFSAKQKKNSGNGNDAAQDREKLLELALAWDALSVAKEHIIKEDLNDLNVRF